MVAVADGSREARFAELYAQANAARTQTRALMGRVRSTQAKVSAECERIRAARERVERIRLLWLAPGDLDPLRYSPYARLQARLVSMPVIEQAKGVIMAQCGWSADQAFDTLRRASQRENIKLRDLAAQIVARTEGQDHPPAALPRGRMVRRAADADVAALAAHRDTRKAAG